MASTTPEQQLVSLWEIFDWKAKYGAVLHYYQMTAEHAYVCVYIVKVLLGFHGVWVFKENILSNWFRHGLKHKKCRDK